MHCLKRLDKLPVTVRHLKITRVGRTVNGLRKYEGPVSDAARALIVKWKYMVAATDSCDEENVSEEDEACVPDAPELYLNQDIMMKYTSNQAKIKEDRRWEKAHEWSQVHAAVEVTPDPSVEQPVDTQPVPATNATAPLDPTDEVRPEDSIDNCSDQSTAETYQEPGEDSDEAYVKDPEAERGSQIIEGRRRGRRGAEPGTRNGNEEIEEPMEEPADERSDSQVSSSNNGDNVPIVGTIEAVPKGRAPIKRARNADDDDDESDQVFPDTSIASDSDEYVPHRKLGKRETPASPPTQEQGIQPSSSNLPCSPVKSQEESGSTHHSSSRSSHRSRNEESKHRKSRSERREAEKRREAARKSTTESSSSKSKSSRSNKHSRSHSRSHRHSSSSSSSKDQAGTSKDHAGTSKDHAGTSKDQAGPSRLPDTPKEQSKSNKKEHKSDSDGKSKFKEPKEPKPKKMKIHDNDGIDGNSGASFAEALGMCMDRKSSKKKLASPTPLVKSIKKETTTSSSSRSNKTEPGTSRSLPTVKNEASTSGTSTSMGSTNGTVKAKSESRVSNYSPPLTLEQPPSLLAPNAKLEPLNVELAATLPDISPNYRPLPSVVINSVHRKQEEANALSEVIYAKSQRTKVYSGVKSGCARVQSLYDLCIQNLIQNIDGLRFTGGIPYFILKPVLERATAGQLFTIEHYNDYLEEETTEMWEFHCKREFPRKQREDEESWRDLYLVFITLFYWISYLFILVEFGAVKSWRIFMSMCQRESTDLLIVSIPSNRRESFFYV